jgi:hypothetical protein
VRREKEQARAAKKPRERRGFIRFFLLPLLI